MVFNTTFNNISVIMWRSVLLVEGTGVLGENHQPIDCNWKNILLLNYAVFKTIVHVLVLYQTSNKLG
jgi:hypothetical protein